MTDTAGQRGPFQPSQGRRRSHRPVSLDGVPTPEELAASPHKGEAADRFSLYTPAQIEDETKSARLFMAFDEPIKIRDQAEMVIAAMRIIIELTKAHDMGSINQRIEARREAASLGQRLAIFNGKTPYGFRRKVR